jgi:hypothetical protein
VHQTLTTGGFLSSARLSWVSDNLALAVAGKLDTYSAALWDQRQIKLWSVATLSKLLVNKRIKVAKSYGWAACHH